MTTKMTILKFYSDDCAHCKSLDRDLQIINAKTPLNIQNVDIHQNYDLVEKYDIMKLPTLVILRNDSLVPYLVGYFGFDAVATFIEDNYCP